MRPATYVTVIALTLSPVVNYLLIYHLGGGLDGAALAVDTVQVRRGSAAAGRVLHAKPLAPPFTPPHPSPRAAHAAHRA